MGTCPTNRSNDAVIKPKNSGVVLKALTMSRQYRYKEVMLPPVDMFSGTKIKSKEALVAVLQFLPESHVPLSVVTLTKNR